MGYEVRRNRISRRWRVVLVDDGNHEVLSVSETLNSKAAVDKNIAATRAAADGEVTWPT